MTWLNKPNPEQTARLYKVLTAGSDLATDVAKSPHFRPQQVSVQPKIQLAPVVQPKVFNIADKTLLPKFDASKRVPVKRDPKLIEGLPSAGSIFCGFKCRGVNNHIKKELKDTGYKYDLVSKLKDANLDVGKDLEDLEITRAGKNFILENIAPPPAKKVEQIEPETFSPAAPASGTPLVTKVPPLMIKTSGRRSGRKPSDLEDQLANIIPAEMPDNTPPVPAVAPVSNKKETKNERIGRVANEIVANWEKIREAIDGFKVMNMRQSKLEVLPSTSFGIIFFFCSRPAFSANKSATSRSTPCFFSVT